MGQSVKNIIFIIVKILESFFLHNSHIQTKDDETLDVEEKVSKKAKVKEINYFEHYPMITTKNELMNSV